MKMLDYAHYLYPAAGWLLLYLAAKAYKRLPKRQPVPFQEDVFAFILSHLRNVEWVNHRNNPFQNQIIHGNPQNLPQGPLYPQTIRSHHTVRPVVTISLGLPELVQICVNGEWVNQDLTTRQLRTISKRAEGINDEINRRFDNACKVHGDQVSRDRLARVARAARHPVLCCIHDQSLVKGSTPDVFRVSHGTRRRVIEVLDQPVQQLKDQDLALIPLSPHEPTPPRRP